MVLTLRSTRIGDRVAGHHFWNRPMGALAYTAIKVSTFAAQMKSFSDNPPMACVE